MNRNEFIAHFGQALDLLKNSEKVTRDTLRTLSRELLEALHCQGEGHDATLYGDIQFVNSVLPVLTPVNYKAFLLFMRHFTGFHFDEGVNVFTKKSKKRYDEARNKSLLMLQDPHFNFWSWAEREIDIQRKPFDDERITKFVNGAIKKMEGDQARVLRAIIKGGITPHAMMVVLEEMAVENAAAAQEEQK